jgi:hypothetical protein
MTALNAIDLSGGCVQKDTITIQYLPNSTDNTVQIARNCSNPCSGLQCQANTTAQAALVGSYSLTGSTAGSTLTLTFTNYNCGNLSGGGSSTGHQIYSKQ